MQYVLYVWAEGNMMIEWVQNFHKKYNEKGSIQFDLNDLCQCLQNYSHITKLIIRSNFAKVNISKTFHTEQKVHVLDWIFCPLYLKLVCHWCCNSNDYRRHTFCIPAGFFISSYLHSAFLFSTKVAGTKCCPVSLYTVAVGRHPFIMTHNKGQGKATTSTFPSYNTSLRVDPQVQ